MENRSLLTTKFLKGLGAIINGVSDGLVNIGSQIGSTAKAVIVKFRMIPRTKGTKFSGKFYRAFYWADELMAPAILGFFIILLSLAGVKYPLWPG